MNISVDLMGVIFGLLLILAASLAWKTSRSTDSPFSLEDLFLNRKTGKADLGKVGQFCALSVSTWGFAVLTLRGELTEFYFVGYMVAWTGANLGSKVIDKKKDEQ